MAPSFPVLRFPGPCSITYTNSATVMKRTLFGVRPVIPGHLQTVWLWVSHFISELPFLLCRGKPRPSPHGYRDVSVKRGVLGLAPGWGSPEVHKEQQSTSLRKVWGPEKHRGSRTQSWDWKSTGLEAGSHPGRSKGEGLPAGLGWILLKTEPCENGTEQAAQTTHF